MLTLKVPSLWGRRFKNSESFTTTVAVLLKAGLLTKEDVKKKLGVNVTDAFMKRCAAENEVAKDETVEDEDEDEVDEDEEDTDAVQKAVGDVHGQRNAGAQTAGTNSGATGRGNNGKAASAATRTTQAASQPAKSR